jgi:RecA-family ATPase
MTTTPLHEQSLPVVRAAELDETPSEQRWLIETLWTQCGVGVIGGTAKSLKTWLGLEMAVSVASATPCLQQFTTQQPGPALIYLAEDRLCMVRERLEALCAHRGLGLEALDLHVITVPSLRLDTEIDVARLDATISIYTPRLLLLDPFVRLHRSDENSAQDVAAILASLREMQRRHELAIVVAHHTRKNHRATQHGQMLRGSGDFHAWADSALYLTHDKETLRLTIEHRSAPAPNPRFLRLTGNPPHLTLVEIQPQDDGQPSIEDRVLQTLQRSPTPIRRNQLRALLAINNARLGRVLETLEQRGRIHRTRHGWAC